MITYKHDVTAVAPITAVRPTFGDKLLATKAHAASAAFARSNENLCTIDKHGNEGTQAQRHEGTEGIRRYRMR